MYTNILHVIEHWQFPTTMESQTQNQPNADAYLNLSSV